MSSLKRPLLGDDNNDSIYSEQEKESMLITPLSPTINNKAYDYLFKVIIVGDAGVGKSSILTKYVDGEWSNTYVQTVGVDFKIRTIVFEDVTVKLQIWDTTGQERFRTITQSYYKGSHIFIVVFDITNHDSFQNVETHLSEIDEFADPQQLFHKMLIGNKCDLEHTRIVNFEQGQDMADSHDIKYMECSAKIGTNIDAMFKYAAKSAVIKKKEFDSIRAMEMAQRTNSLSTVSTQKPTKCCIIL